MRKVWSSPHLNSGLGHQQQPVNIFLTQQVEVSREVCELIFSLLKHVGKKQYYYIIATELIIV